MLYYGRDDGQFASQLLLLKAGNYELRMQVTRENKGEAESGLTWTLTCRPDAKQLLALNLSKANSRSGALVGRFTVPANCLAQQLSLNGIYSEFAKSEQVTIGNLQLVGGVR